MNMSRFARFLVLATLICLPALSTSVFGQDLAGAQGHEQSMKTEQGKFIQALGDHVISLIADKNMTADKRNTVFQGILRDSFDLKTIGRFVIGRTWNTATPEQQADYIDLFQKLVVKSYGDRFSLYTGEGFTVVNVRPESEIDSTVNSLITHPDGSQPTTIDWRVRKKDGKLGIIDVVVEGVSLSVTQRQEYAAVIQRNGGQINGLLDVMRQELTGKPTSN